ncbi:RecQ family ATP-dependent DNA helicase [Lapidilactobacillus luobeiensis]|uniref:RecQ family ATP-dependent DNA helicase n=1 Tax=Lapidilactobacillus luobeiensis TaxID=2950371 RepID=UPI0021C33B4C|nr:RecQ family ATP-dependent DNA helicase [Lapidilactobacillus luobeiensis]
MTATNQSTSGSDNGSVTTEQLENELTQRFGFAHFRPGQAPLLQALLSGRDALGILPTGSGKSLLYQFLSPHINGLIVVVSPLISLMADQAGRIRRQNLGKVAVLNSQLTVAERQLVLQQLEQYRFVFLAPETLQQPAVQQRLRQITVGLLVIDEAHCISSWGPDFRPSYLRLGIIRQQIRPQRTLALTATANRRVRQDILKNLRLAATTFVYQASVDRPNIYLRLQTVADETSKWQQTLMLVGQQVPTLIYVATRREAEELTQRLDQQQPGIAAFYHAGLSTSERNQIQQLFLKNQLRVVVATSAFGMGIDKSNLRLVIHYQLPANFESYLQEIGRAGRDGQPALAVIFVMASDQQRLSQRLLRNRLTPGSIQRFFDHPDDPQQLDTNQQGILQAYRQAELPAAQVIAILQTTAELRFQQWQKFWTYLTSTTCLRQQLCDYFDPEPAQLHHSDHCCSQAPTPSLTTVLARLQLAQIASAPPAAARHLRQPAAVLRQLFIES